MCTENVLDDDIKKKQNIRAECVEKKILSVSRLVETFGSSIYLFYFLSQIPLF